MNSIDQAYSHSKLGLEPRELPSSLKRYAPLAVAFVVTAFLTYFDIKLLAKTHMVMAAQVMNIFMGIYFIVYSLPKLMNLPGFARSFQQYDLIAQKFTTFGYVYPIIEMTLGLSYLVMAASMTSATSLALNGAVIALTIVNIVSIVKKNRQQKNVSCSCLGSMFRMPLSNVIVVENSLMLVMAVLMILMFQSMAM